MTIAGSPDSDVVDHDGAIWLLQARAVMTTAVCCELDAGFDFWNRRAFIALMFLRTWVRDELGYEGGPGDGLPPLSKNGPAHDTARSMTVPEDGRALLCEIIAGVRTCELLQMLWTADSEADVRSDGDKLAVALEEWRTARDTGYFWPVVVKAAPISPKPGVMLQKPNLLYMIEHPGLRLRKVGVTTTVRLETWRRRGWTTIATREYPDLEHLRAAEDLAIERLDRRNARGSLFMSGVFANLAQDGRTEMYDPKFFHGDLDRLLSDDLGDALSKSAAMIPQWISDPKKAAANKAWQHPNRDGAAAAKKAVATRKKNSKTGKGSAPTA